MKSFTVKDLPPDERPRERLAKFGAEVLSLHELLAIVLGRGVKGESVMNTAQKIVSKFGTLEALQEASLEDIQEIKGLGPAKACQLKACLELSKRFNKALQPDKNKRKNKTLTSAKEVYEALRKKIGGLKKENFVVVSLDTRNKIIAVDTVFVGTLNSSLVHPREIFETAIRRHAAGIVVAHNHPSGDPEPSDEDIKVTKLLTEAAKVMGIEMPDHLIIGEGKYFTFRDNVIHHL
jgi:DNA repair protein RadC